MISFVAYIGFPEPLQPAVSTERNSRMWALLPSCRRMLAAVTVFQGKGPEYSWAVAGFAHSVSSEDATCPEKQHNTTAAATFTGAPTLRISCAVTHT